MNKAIFTEDHMSYGAKELITDLVSFNCPVDGSWLEPEYKWLSDFYKKSTNNYTTSMRLSIELASSVLPDFRRIKYENEKELVNELDECWIFKYKSFNKMVGHLEEFSSTGLLPTIPSDAE